MRWILWLSLAAAIADGQERFQLYTTDNGLPHNSVLALLQAKDGYLWLTTYRGLVRFDGLQFQVFNESNTPAIHSTTFAAFSLMQDREGDIWAGAWSGGALRYHNGTFTSYTKRDGLPNNSVTRIDQDDQGDMWFYTSPGLSRLHNGKIEVVTAIDGESVQPYLKMPPTLGGDSHLFGLWRLGRGATGLQRFARGRWSDFPLPPDIPDLAKLRMEVTIEDSRGRLWYTILGRPGESFCVENGRLTIYKGLPPDTFANYRDRLGRLWLTDQKGNTAFWQNGRVTPMPGVSTPSPIRVVEDAQGSFWAGTLNQGLAHSPIQVISTVRLPGGSEANTIRPIMQARQGDIWVGSYGLTRIHQGRFESYTLPESLAKWPGDQTIWTLWEDPDGTIFFSNNNGLRILRDGKIRSPDAPLNQIKTRVNAIIRDRAGNLWMGTGEGVYLYRDATLALVHSENGLPLRGEVRAIAEDRSGTVWIGTDSVLCKQRNTGLACFGSTDELVRWRVRSIVPDRDGVIWVSTADRGLLRIEGNDFRWIQAKDGLYSNDAAGIVEDANGYFWIGSRTGIYRVKKQELNEFAHGAVDHITSSYFGKKDGLNAVDSAGFGQPRGFVAQDGKLWFPTADGLATIDPKAAGFENAPPRVQIESCTLDQNPIACNGSISLPPDAKNLEISYTALDLVRSDQIQFRYRLDGLDTNWVNVGTRRTAYYPHLPPGDYRFQIVGASSFGVWSETPQQLNITVQPHFYQAIWFRAAVAASLIGIFALIWRLRGAQYNKRQAMQRAFAQQIIASQEAERKRIAGELHDSLGQSLTVIKNMALLLSRPNGRNPERQIEAITAETSQALVEVRRISRNLRPYQLDLLGLTKAIEVLVNGTCEAAGIQSTVILENLSGGFHKESEIHLYRIVQECLNNAVKHSGASMITVMARREGSRVSITVSDDGVGFSPERLHRDGTNSGFGLTGISERAQLLGGAASIRSSPGQGTTVTIDIQAEAEVTRDKGQEATHGR